MSPKQQRIITYKYFDASDLPRLPTLNKGRRDNGVKEMSALEFDLWVRFFYPLSKQYPEVYDGVINGGKTLSWIGRHFRALAQKEVLS